VLAFFAVASGYVCKIRLAQGEIYSLLLDQESPNKRLEKSTLFWANRPANGKNGLEQTLFEPPLWKGQIGPLE
jgi:hypothetical protein